MAGAEAVHNAAFTSAACRPALPESIETSHPVQHFLIGGGLPEVVVVAVR